MPSLMPDSPGNIGGSIEQSPPSSVEFNEETGRSSNGNNNNNSNSNHNHSSNSNSNSNNNNTHSNTNTNTNNYLTTLNTYDRLNGTPLAPIAASGFAPATTALEQYRLQLYNYALHMERLRYAPQDHQQHQHQQHQQHHQQQQQRQSPYNITGSLNSPSVYSAAAYVPGNRLALSMSLFPQHIFKPEDPKPQHSYIGLIAMAILSSAELKLVLSDIYQYILDNYPYFRTRGPGWRNSIRHNLSLNDCFVKSGRSANGKGHYWAIHPANMEDFRKGDFRRRKAQRKVRKHMGLSVDDAGTDSPSPPPLDLSSPPPPTVASAIHATSSPHPFTVAQQLAAFGYLQQHRQQQPPINVLAPPLVAHQYNFRPLAARYYITAASAPAAVLPYGTVHPRLNHQVSGNNLKASTATASVIANLYSQTRKRQFDVASLLAPDVDVDVDVAVAVNDNHDAEMQETTTTTTTTTTLDVGGEVAANTTTQLHQTVITKLTMNHQCHHNNSLQHNIAGIAGGVGVAALNEHLSADEQNEDIDVVDVDVDAHSNDADSNDDEAATQMEQWRHHDDIELKHNHVTTIDEATQDNLVYNTNTDSKEIEVSKSNSSSRQSPLSDVTTNAEFLLSSLKNTETGESANRHAGIDAQPLATCLADSLQDQMTPLLNEGYPLTANNNNNNNNNNIHNHTNSPMDPYVFGRYYMAAAARRLHVGSAYNP